MALQVETQVVPRLTFNYRITINGLLAGLCSKVQLPDKEIAEVAHSSGGATHNTKHPGRITYGDLVLEKAMQHEDSDRWAYDLMTTSRDDDGGGDPTERFKVTVEHIADEGARVIDSWTMVDCWVKKVSYSANDALQDSERMIETVTISVRKYDRK